ncbi:corticotropin-releasing factor receptor 1 isoform X1 [Sylvia atricapilla]|uniref:corticotropin-releasing factor receptor 1 isoform X1 n=1 Tax=Sylvia atricapilla TaxID=48155 RepID=UPI00339208F4
MEHPQLLWATHARASPPSQGRMSSLNLLSFSLKSLRYGYRSNFRQQIGLAGGWQAPHVYEKHRFDCSAGVCAVPCIVCPTDTELNRLHISWQVWCRLVTAAYNYFHVTNFFWMFGEGCYLHTAIVLTYSTDKLRKWMFICIGWCIPFPIIVAWAIGKLYYDNEKCWFGKRAGVYTDYIYQGPMILVLLINFIFLFNIVRILMTKLRASTTSETIQYRKAVKATLVLLPLLGITYMLFFVNPGEDEISRIVFIYFNSFLESFQGFFVSVFYCFLNSEVRSAVRKRWHRWQDKHSIRARMARAMSIPTSPTRVSFHSIKQSTAV